MSRPRVMRHAVTQPLDKPYRLIPLTQGQTAIVDIEDFEMLNAFNWCAHKSTSSKTFYAERRDKGKIVKMHSVIFTVPSGYEIDHANRNGLDNRRGNLRVCTHEENGRNQEKHRNNTSGHKGVNWFKPKNKWRSRISVKGHTIELGYFTSLIEAAKAYDEAASKYHGEFSYHMSSKVNTSKKA